MAVVLPELPPVFAAAWRPELGEIEALAADASGNVYAARGVTIKKFTRSGTFLTQWGSFGGEPGKFQGIGAITVDSAGNVYVADSYSRRIEKFTSSGAFVTEWKTSTDPLAPWYPDAVGVDGSGVVYVSEEDGHFIPNTRIAKFTNSGSPLTTWPTPNVWPDFLAVDRSGNVFFSDRDHHITRFTSAGAFVGSWSSPSPFEWFSPSYLATDSAGNVYAADRALEKFTGSGRFLTFWPNAPTGPFFWGQQVAVGGPSIFVWDHDSRQIMRFDPPQLITGPPLRRQEACNCNPAAPNLSGTSGSYGDPCGAATGSFSHSFLDFHIPGRGIPLDLSHSYSSALAAVNGPLGYGWWFGFGMSLTAGSGGQMTVHQENGTEVVFTPAGGGAYSAPLRDVAKLTKNPDGTFTFVRNARELFTFSSSGRLLKKSDLNGNTTVLSYDGSGHLAKVNDPAGRALSFTWSGDRVVGAADPSGRTVAFAYDIGGNLVAATNANGGVTHFTYDAAHRLLTMTDPRGGVVKNTYDSQGRVTSQTDPLGRTTTFGYLGDNFSVGGTTRITDPKGNVTLETYAFGLRRWITRGFGTAAAATSTFEYDPATLGIVKETDANGHVTTRTFDRFGNLVATADALGRKATATYNNLNEVLTSTDPLGVTTTNVYDARGNRLSTSTPVGAATAKTTYAYGDPAHPGDVTSVTDPNGHVWTLAYDLYGNRTKIADPLGNATTSAFDKIGRLTATTAPRGGTTTYAYNLLGDLVNTTTPIGAITAHSYDANGNRIKTVDPTGNVTTNTYDAADELTSSTTGGRTVQTTYDANGNIKAQLNGLGVATQTYAYDPLDRVVSVADGLGRLTRYTYDPVGNVLTRVDAANQATSFAYDEADELTGIDYSDGVTPAIAFSYDADGRRDYMEDGTGTTVYGYDQLGRMTHSVQLDELDATDYEHDLAGNLTRIEYPDGNSVTRTYDGANRLVAVSNWLAAPNTVTFAYDADDNLIKETYPNGVITTFIYDLADRLTSTTATKGVTKLLGLPYVRNKSDLVTAEAGRTFAYDGLNRVVADSLATTAFTYDAADQVTKLTSSGTPVNLSYDNANQLKFSSATGGTTNYGYSNLGSRLSTNPPSGSASAFSYDQANRLTGFSQGATKATYTYNGDGLRVSSTVNGAKRAFVWDVAEGLPLILVDGTNRYVTGPGGLPLERIGAADDVNYYHQDQLGSTRMITSSSGAVLKSYTYNAYGTLASSTGAINQPFGFAGQYTDAESGLIYLRARYYEPSTAQFLTRDPAVALTGTPYAYAGNDPANAADPTGAGVFEADCQGLASCAKIKWIEAKILANDLLNEYGAKYLHLCEEKLQAWHQSPLGKKLDEHLEEKIRGELEEKAFEKATWSLDRFCHFEGKCSTAISLAEAEHSMASSFLSILSLPGEIKSAGELFMLTIGQKAMNSTNERFESRILDAENYTGSKR